MRRGFTLVEVLVAGALLLTLIALSVQVFIPALGIWRRNQARATVQQAALATSYRIRHDLFHSAPDVLETRPRLLILLGSQGFDEDGAPLWNHWIGYWLDDQKRLWRFTREFPAAAEVPASIPAGMPSDEDLRARGRIVARDVDSFLPERGPTGGARYKLALEFGGFSYELLGGGVSAYQGDS